MSEELEFFRRPEPITQCDETVECDVAVPGRQVSPARSARVSSE